MTARRFDTRRLVDRSLAARRLGSGGPTIPVIRKRRFFSGSILLRSMPATTQRLDASTDRNDAAARSLIRRFADLRVKLRFHRADLYLAVAVFVAALGLLWPAAGSPRPAALGPWERALVTLGIAEAPAPAIHLQGDPAIEVWVDPHTALYYCPGEEQYGKTAGGRLTSQRDAQMDRFQPSGRSVCE